MVGSAALTPAARRMISQVGIGRIALSQGALPLVLVVRCEVGDDQVSLLGDDPALTRAALAGDVVALQVDDLHPDGVGSSLVLTGVLSRTAEQGTVLRPSIVTRTDLHLRPPMDRPD